MSHFAAVKSPLSVAIAAAAVVGDAKSPLLCPKPRRPAATPLRCHQSGGYHDAGAGAGMDLLDLLLSKGEEGGLSSASSPQPPPFFCGSPSPFFCGSPPRRVSNPVVHDSRFGADCPPVPAARAPRPAAAPPMSPRGCARARFAFQPAAVRVEGFDCLDGGRRGRRGHGITAMA